MIRSPAVHAAVGAAASMVWALTVQPSWTSSLLMLSPAALVPLGLGLACRPDAGPTTPVLDSLRLSAGPAALLAMAAFVPERGAIAAAMTLPWLVIGLAAGVIGVGRFLSRRRCDPTVGVDAALVFLAVGAGWLTISRVGANPLGFSGAIVQLTAVHFHYAGFALPLVAGLAARHCGRGPLVAAWVILGVPVTAAGITAGGIVEWVAATMMATGGLATAGLLARTAVAQRRAARWLLLLAATSLATGMALALGWAWSIQFGWDYLDLDQMARWHGTLNAVGFGFGALAGLHITPLGDVPVEHLALHLGCPSHDVMSVVSAAAHRTEPTGPVGLLQRPNPVGYRSDAWTGPLPHGFEPACSALRHWVGHRAAGITVAEPAPPIAAGQTVTMAIPVGPISVTAAARIIDVVDEADRYGFTYATLPHHPEDGEESFIITRDAGGDASYTVTAVWRTGTYASRALPPLTRYLQRRAISRYLAGVAGWPTDTEHEASRA